MIDTRGPPAMLVTDNGAQYTATATVLYTHELGLVPITTAAYSLESNGLAEAFIGTFKRDYVDGAELRDADDREGKLPRPDRAEKLGPNATARRVRPNAPNADAARRR